MVSPKPRWGAQKTIFACSFERGLKLPWALSRCPGPFCVDQAQKIIGGLKQTPWCQGEGTFVEKQAQPSHNAKAKVCCKSKWPFLKSYSNGDGGRRGKYSAALATRMALQGRVSL
jgi:hypothetical protein